MQVPALSLWHFSERGKDMELEALGRWGSILDLGEFDSLFDKVDAAYETAEVYPQKKDLFSAFALTPPDKVRVVILGQDPYHEPGQAHGLAFSVKEGVKLPPSLRNIYTERQSDTGVPPSQSGDLTHWAAQGVLLLNTVLTVERGKANSHKDYGWQSFTDTVVDELADLPQPIAFVLWGAQAQKKAAAAASSPYPRLILQGPHPSPLSAYRGFFGSKPFSRINEFLTEHGETPIQW